MCTCAYIHVSTPKLLIRYCSYSTNFWWKNIRFYDIQLHSQNLPIKKFKNITIFTGAWWKMMSICQNVFPLTVWRMNIHHSFTCQNFAFMHENNQLNNLYCLLFALKLDCWAIAGNTTQQIAEKLAIVEKERKVNYKERSPYTCCH